LSFIKRRFARYFHLFQIDENEQKNQQTFKPIRLKGWSFVSVPEDTQDYDPTHVPSLPFLAALPFMKSAYKSLSVHNKVANEPKDKMVENKDEATSLEIYTRFLTNANKLRQPSRHVSVSSLNELIEQTELLISANYIDGQAFFPSGLMRDAAAQQVGISNALNAFTHKVPNVVSSHDGFLVYAGGDDVLALLPIDTVLACAFELEQCYANCFNLAHGSKPNPKKPFSTLSGAIQLSHIRIPLMKIVAQAHHLLDDVAKDKSGRHSLAIRINKPGGVHAEWVMPFDKLKAESDQIDILSNAIAVFTEKPAQITQGLIFKLIDVLEQMGSGDIDKSLLMSVLKAEYAHSGEQLGLKKAEIEQDLQNLSALVTCTATYKREFDTDNYQSSMLSSSELQSDGLKVVRFFASKGIERKMDL